MHQSRDRRTPSEMARWPHAPVAPRAQCCGGPGPALVPSCSPPPAVAHPTRGAPAGPQGLVQPWARCTAGKNRLLASHCCLGSKSFHASPAGHTCCQGRLPPAARGPAVLTAVRLWQNQGLKLGLRDTDWDAGTPYSSLGPC